MSRVLMLCKAYPPVVGGVESFSEQVARAYLRRDFEVTVVTQTDGGKGWAARECPEGRIAIYNTGSGGQLVTALRMLSAVFVTTGRQRFDLFHATTWRPAATLIAKRCRAPMVITVHGREILAVPHSLRPIMCAVLRSATLVVAVSSATRHRAEVRLRGKVDASEWLVAGNGLSFAERSQADVNRSHSSDRVRILTLARLVERKNVQGCIQALQVLKEAGRDNFEYRIAGRGPLLPSLQDQVREAGLSENVAFLGYVDDDEVCNLYKWADVFLHPQIDLGGGEDFEGFGIAIADAMSFGCLAIAGSGSGPSDFITNGLTGILVDGANPVDLQQAIASVLANPSAYKGIAQAGRKSVLEELSWDRHVGAILSALSTRR